MSTSRRSTLLASSATLLVCVLLIVDLALMDSVWELVLIGTIGSEQLIPVLVAIGIAALSTVLLTLASGNWIGESGARGVISIGMIIIVIVAGSAAFLVTSGIALLSGVRTYTRLDVPDAGREYVVLGVGLHHMGYSLYEGNGILFTSARVSLPLSDPPSDYIAQGAYRVTQHGDGWLLEYSSQGDGAFDVAVPFGGDS